MSTNEGDTLNSIVLPSTYGNAVLHDAVHNWTSEAEDDVVLLARVKKGFTITDMKMIFGALGAARTMDIGFKPVGGTLVTADPDYFTAGVADTGPTDVSAAGSVVFQFVPFTCLADIYITATLAGAAGADADTHVVFNASYKTRGPGHRL